MLANSLDSGKINYFGRYPGDMTTKRGIGRAVGDIWQNTVNQEEQALGRRGQQYGELFGGYSDLAHGGSAADNNALEQSILTPLGGAYDQARQAGARHLASTKNSAGYGSFLGELARGQARDYSTAGQNIAQEKFNRKLAGLQGIQQLFGIDTSFLNSLGERQLQALSIGSGVQSRRGSLFGDIMGGLKSIGGGIAGAF